MTELEKWAKQFAGPTFDPSSESAFLAGAQAMQEKCAEEAKHLFDIYSGPHRKCSPSAIKQSILLIGTKEFK